MTESPTVFNIQGRIEAHFKESQQLLDDLRHHEDARVRIAASAEMRHMLELVGRLLAAATNAEAIRQFQITVLDALAEAGIDVRRKIMGLFESQAQDPEPDQPDNPGD